MPIDRDEIGKAIRRHAAAERQRGHATWFHASNEFQSAMEVTWAAEWARTVNGLNGWTIREIRKNPKEYPDCLADIGPEDTKRPAVIGIEVTELVDREAIVAHQQARNLARTGRLDQMSDAERLDLHNRMNPEWPLEKFQERLVERVKEKDKRQRDASLKKQFLLILTGEPDLDADTLTRYMDAIALPRPKNFDCVYIIPSSYDPDRNGEGYYPVFDIPLAKA